MDSEVLMRTPCKNCKYVIGVIQTRGGQDCVFCGQCKAWNYNAPKRETGREVRPVSMRGDIKPKQRARLLGRANGRCEMCGKNARDAVLHVAHLISVRDGESSGLTHEQINHDENLCVMCDECNLGLGGQTVSLRFAVSLLMSRMDSTNGTRNEQSGDDSPGTTGSQAVGALEDHQAGWKRNKGSVSANIGTSKGE